MPETAIKSPCGGYSLDADTLRAWYTRTRARSRQLFSLLTDDAYYSQPIALRHPIVFYDGHLPGVQLQYAREKSTRRTEHRRASRAAVRARHRPRRSRGDGRHDQPISGRSGPTAPRSASSSQRPTAGCCTRSAEPISTVPAIRCSTTPKRCSRSSNTKRCIRRRCSTSGIACPSAAKHRPAGYSPRTAGTVPRHEWVPIPEGTATLGVDRGTIPFGWDNEFPHSARAGAAVLDRTRQCDQRPLSRVRRRRRLSQRLAVAAGRLGSGCRPKASTHPLFWERLEDKWYWRGMFDLIPLPPAWPVYVTHAEATAFARWSGARLPTEGEFQRAAFGSPEGERPHPWGTEVADARRGVFDFSSWDPEPAGSHPEGASAWGVHDLVGNGWEWTSTTFAAIRRLHADGVLSGVLRRFLRRRALRHERGVVGNGTRAAAADFPQLVPRPLSLRLRQLSMCERRCLK